jgi:hypothetical protein
LIDDEVILIEDYDIVKGSFEIEPLYGCDGDVVVNHCKLLCCLVTEEVIRFNYENTLPQGTVVLCDKALNPCLT